MKHISQTSAHTAIQKMTHSRQFCDGVTGQLLSFAVPDSDLIEVQSQAIILSVCGLKGIGNE